MFNKVRRRSSGSGPPEDRQAAEAIRDALSRTDTPLVSPDFNAQVLAAVSSRSPWWNLALSYFQPALTTAAASAVVTILLINMPGHAGNPALAASAPAPAIAIRREATDTAIDDRLDALLNSSRPTYLAFAALQAAPLAPRVVPHPRS
ncbi:MAG TPA: hypothetical protein VGM37_01155 [Armatimonadota bacterium]